MINFEKEFLKLAYPHIIHYCLINNKITKFDNVDSIRQVVAENLEEIVDSLHYSVSYYDELKDGIRSVIKNNGHETAIILVGTYIENAVSSPTLVDKTHGCILKIGSSR